MELCVDVTVEEWRKHASKLDTNDEKEWQWAIGVFERRMEERFFRCIDVLLKADSRSDGIVPGFSIMALCCLLAETLQAFFEGRTMSDGSTARAFKDFLKRSIFFKDSFNSELRGDFSQDVRNAILHDAETRGGWLIERTIPNKAIVEKVKVDGEKSQYILNRTKFYEALRREFKDYLEKLKNPSEGDLRQNFLTKMDGICETEFKKKGKRSNPLKIAILGWGSLIWDPRDLPIKGTWQKGGPELPIEFSRISSDGRLTLVIDPRNGKPVPTQFVLSPRSDIEDTICDLRAREGTLCEHVGYVDLKHGRQRCTVYPKAAELIREWTKEQGFDTVVWTDLPPNFTEEFPGKKNYSFSLEHAEEYLNSLPVSVAKRARKYIKNAPTEVDTTLRRRLRDTGWLDD